VAGDVMDSYRRISLGLLQGLRLLGVDATLAPPASPAQSHGIPKPAACFAAPSPHEIMVNGRKIIGSAQRRQGNALLQHGSLLLDLDVDKLMALLRFTSEEERQAMTARVRQESVTLRSLLGRAVDYAEVTQALVAGFSSGLDIALTPGMLSAQEEEEAARLRRDKYTADAWRFRK
jgi:lipoate-protein ligase A